MGTGKEDAATAATGAEAARVKRGFASTMIALAQKRTIVNRHAISRRVHQANKKTRNV